jgi:beta-phosphoglucomutase family hydrolase
MRLGLPDGVRACLFDLDGVLTETASVHAAAWKEMFDSFLQHWAAEHHQPFVPFDQHDDYDQYVDGKPRLDGVRDFLASRGIHLPEGTPDDDVSSDTVNGLGRRKNDLVLRRIHQDGVAAYPGSVAYVRAARDAGLLRAVVSSSNNTRDVLAAAHIEDLFQEIVDGVVAEREKLRGKPAPDTYLAGARLLGVKPSAAAVFEDALAGVESGRAGHFGYVVGVDRVGQAEALKEHGAERVVEDLGELLDPEGRS